MEQKPKITHSQTLNLLNMDKATLWRIRKDPEKKFPAAYRIGKYIYFDRDEVLAWIESCREA